MPASIQGVPTFQHCRFTQSRASRLSRQPMTRSTSAKTPRPEVGDHVAVPGDDPDLGVQLAGTQRGDLGLGPAAVLGPEQDRPRQVRRLDDVQVDHLDRPQADERQVLQDLVAQGAGADDQHPRRLEPLLPPPGDEAQPAVSVEVVDDQRVGVGAAGTDGMARASWNSVARRVGSSTGPGRGQAALLDENDLVAGEPAGSRPAISRRTSAATLTVSAPGGAASRGGRAKSGGFDRPRRLPRAGSRPAIRAPG